MELHDLKIFHYIATEQSFSKAAQELFISQPAVSASIKKLEFDMGCKMFERSGKSIRLTSAGQILFEYTTKIFDILHDIYADIGNQSGEIKGTIIIAVDEAVVSPLLLQIISSFILKYENVDMQMHITSELIAKRWVEEGRADFSIVGGINEEKIASQLCFEKIADDKVVLIGTDVLPIENEDDIGAFDKLNFIMHEKGSTLSAIGVDVCVNLGLKKGRRLAINSVNAVVNAVKATAGLAVVPLSLVYEEIKLGRVKHLFPTEISIDFPYYILHQKSRAKSLSEITLVEFIKARLTPMLQNDE